MEDMPPELNRSLSTQATELRDEVERRFHKRAVQRLEILRYNSDDLDYLFTGLSFRNYTRISIDLYDHHIDVTGKILEEHIPRLGELRHLSTESDNKMSELALEVHQLYLSLKMWEYI